VVDALVRSGIPVMGHLGLTPQSVHRFGYRRQANDPISQGSACAAKAEDLQAAGCFALVARTCALRKLAGRCGGSWGDPVIGIGAGERLRRLPRCG